MHSKVRRNSQLDGSLGFQEIVGIVDTKHIQTLNRLVFRCTKGNFIMVNQEIRDQSDTAKSMFQILLQNSPVVRNKL